jgi:fucose permease
MIIAVAAVVIFIYGMFASMLGTIVPGLGIRMGLTNAQVSFLALAQGLGLVASSVSAGAFMDRYGRKPGIILGLCMGVIGATILSQAKILVLSMIAMALLGVCGGFVIVGANALVNDVSEKTKASALNILNLFVGLGGMATPFVAGNLLHSDPTKVAYCGSAIATLALALTLVCRIPGSLRPESYENGGDFREKALYILSTITFLYTACEFAIWNWLPKFLVAANVATATALNILSLGFACGMLFGRLAAATILAKMSPWWVTLNAIVIAGISTFAMLHVTTQFALSIFVFIVGTAMAPVFPTTIAILGSVCRQRSATAIGFAITCGFSGLVLSSPLIAALAGPDPRGLGRALLLIPLFSLLIAAILIVFRKQLTTEKRLVGFTRP